MPQTADQRTIPDWLLQLYPFAQHYWAGENGSKRTALHYLDEGSGPVVLFLHGNPSWSFLYRNLVQRLRHRFRCLAPDHLGCGFSAQPVDPRLYDLRQHTDRLENLIRGLDIDRFHLFAHDWGGAIGCNLVRRFPDRLSRIILCNTAAFPFPFLPWRIAICRWPLLGEFITRGLNGFVRAATWMTTVRSLPGPVKRAYLWPHDNWQRRLSVWRFVRDIPMHPRHPSWKELRGIEDSLTGLRKHRALLCWGMRDWCFHEEFLRAWQRRLPQAETLALSQAGHWLSEDEPELLAARVEQFLAAA